MFKLGVAILVVIQLGIVSIAYVNYPIGVNGVLYWGMVSWLLFLVFLNWLASVYTIFFGTRKPTARIFGVLPSLNITVFIYSIISASLLPFWSMFFIGESDENNLNSVDINLTFQIISFIFCAVIVLVIFMAGKAAEVTLPDGIISPRELASEVEVLLLSVPNDNVTLKTQFTKLIEVIRYSLPHPSVLKEMTPYEKLTNDIRSLDLGKLSDEEANLVVRELSITASQCQHRRT